MTHEKLIEAEGGKEAQIGTIMYRRADVRSILFKLNNRYLSAMRAAERDGNNEWRFNAVQKLRLISEIREFLETECPAFENQSPAPEAMLEAAKE